MDGPVESRGAEVFVALALDHAQSQVSRGENAGRNLTHVGVVKKLEKIGEFRTGEGFAKDIEFKIDPAISGNLRIVAFVQQHGLGRILGAAQHVVREH